VNRIRPDTASRAIAKAWGDKVESSTEPWFSHREFKRKNGDNRLSDGQVGARRIVRNLSGEHEWPVWAREPNR